MGSLFVVPTPIGNLEDITLRALRILAEVTLIAAEDTRTTGRLLAHFKIKTPLTSYHEHNKLAKLDTILVALQVGDVALVSDAGTPGLSDPGYELIGAAVEAGFTVIPLPGPNALLPALVASGLPTETFLYLGFLPRKLAERRTSLHMVSSLPYTLVFYEAPHRLHETMKDMLEIFGARQAVVARELTKIHEQIWRGPLDEALDQFAGDVKGEVTLVIAGCEPPAAVQWDETQVRTEIRLRLAQGETRSAAAREVARLSGWPRRDVYDLEE